ncbi:MAG TPA: MMPL family transporter [Thermoanaerobaculia bacterium]
MLRLTRLALRFPVLCLTGMLLATGVFALGLLRLRLQTDGAALHPASNPVVARAAADREVFHDSDLLILLIAPRPGGPPVTSPQGFAFLREIDPALRGLPGVRGAGVRSLAGLLDLRVTPESLSAEPFLATVPADAAGFSRLAGRIRQHALAQGVLINPAGTAAAVYLPLADGAGRLETLAEVERLAGSLERTGPFRVFLIGPLVAEARLGEAVLADLGRLIPVMVVFLCGLFWLLLRSPGAILVLFAEVCLVLIWTLGAMGWAGVPLTLVTTLLPVLLMAVAITDEIHVLERLQNRLREALATAPADADPRAVLRESLLSAMGELERPILASALTTALGFFAFPFTPIRPLQHFGVFSTLGLLAAMFLSFTAMPALLVLLPPRWVLPLAVTRRGALRRSRLLPYERLLVRWRRGGAVAGCVLVALAVPGLLRLRVGDNWVANFDPGSELVRADRLFNRELWGSYRFDVVLAGPPGFFFRREGGALVEEVAQRAAGFQGVAGVLTHLVPVTEVARAHGEVRPVSALPAARFEDFLTLATISEDPFGLVSWVSADGGMARVQMFLKSEDYRRDRRLAEELDRSLAAPLGEAGIRYHFSGDIPVGLEMVNAIVHNQLRSLGLTLLATAVLLLVLERLAWRAVLAVLLPVIAAAALVFASMGYIGVPLGVATSMFGSLTVGVGIDFGLHFLHTWHRERERSGDPQQALAATFEKTGKALRWSLIALALGFAVLTLSDLRPNRSLGVLLAAAMVASYGMTVLWMPALAAWSDRRKGKEAR